MGDIRGDLLCFAAQISYTIYLTVFGWLAKRYSIFTVNKWMFLSATCIIWPFTAYHVWQTPWSTLSAVTLGEILYVVVGGTFLAYILMIRGQQVLRPTVVSMYNYDRPSFKGVVYPIECYFPTWVLPEDHKVCTSAVAAYKDLFGDKRIGNAKTTPERYAPVGVTTAEDIAKNYISRQAPPPPRSMLIDLSEI